MPSGVRVRVPPRPFAERGLRIISTPCIYNAWKIKLFVQSVVASLIEGSRGKPIKKENTMTVFGVANNFVVEIVLRSLEIKK